MKWKPTLLLSLGLLGILGAWLGYQYWNEPEAQADPAELNLVLDRLAANLQQSRDLMEESRNGKPTHDIIHRFFKVLIERNKIIKEWESTQILSERGKQLILELREVEKAEDEFMAKITPAKQSEE